MRFDQRLIRDIIERIDIVSFIGRYIDIKKSGKNYMAVCPFHDDKGPSLSISPEKGLYHCFGCGASGTVITFLMEYEHLTFPEAIEILAKEAGITLKKAKKDSLKEKYKKINGLARDFFYGNLMYKKEWKNAREYLKMRAIKKEIVERFNIGYAPGGWKNLVDYLTEYNISLDDAAKLDLVKNKNGNYYDTFRDRIIFPIFDLYNDVIAFGGRVIGDAEPKYYNSAETPLFKKSAIFYGINFAKKSIYRDKEVVIVEGYLDLIRLHQIGVENSVAVLGTAFTQHHLPLLKGKVKRIYLFFDNDKAGEIATIRSLQILFNQEAAVYVIRPKGGKDPDEVLKKGGKKYFEQLKENAIPGFDFFVDVLTKGKNMNNPQEKFSVYSEIKRKLVEIENSVLKEFYLQKLNEKFGIKTDKKYKPKVKRRKNNKFPSFYPIEEVMIIMFILERTSYAERIFSIEHLEIFFSEEKLKEAFLLLKKRFLAGEDIVFKGNVEYLIYDTKLKREIATYYSKDAIPLSEDVFESFITDLYKKVKVKKIKGGYI